jgi:4'-phosphopantetheinyl transferase
MMPVMTVEVHWARTVSSAALADALTRGERDRVGTIQNAESRDAIASSLLLARTAVGAWAGVDADSVELDRRCPRCGSRAHGRPSASWRGMSTSPPPHLSLARTTGTVVVAVTLAGEVGVDVERRTDQVFAGFDDVVVATTEARPVDDEARLRTWVRKEAVLKAIGRGLDVDPRALVLSPGDQPPRIERGPAGPWHLQDLDPAEGTTGALAVRATSPVSVQVTQVRLAGRH